MFFNLIHVDDNFGISVLNWHYINKWCLQFPISKDTCRLSNSYLGFPIRMIASTCATVSYIVAIKYSWNCAQKRKTVISPLLSIQGRIQDLSQGDARSVQKNVEVGTKKRGAVCEKLFWPEKLKGSKLMTKDWKARFLTYHS